MASAKMLAFLAFACVASVAQGSLLSEDFPAAITQQRSLLAPAATPAYYTAGPRPKPRAPKNERITATVTLLVATKKNQFTTSTWAASYLVKLLRAVQKEYNEMYLAKNNISVKLKYRSTRFKGQAWVTVIIGADIGPKGVSYKAALKAALKAAVKKTTCPRRYKGRKIIWLAPRRTCVKVVRGGF